MLWFAGVVMTYPRKSRTLEAIGVLVKKGLIDVELVDDLFSSYIIRYWEKYESIELETRERNIIPQSGEWVEYLYGVVKRIALEQHPELREKDLQMPGELYG